MISRIKLLAAIKKGLEKEAWTCNECGKLRLEGKIDFRLVTEAIYKEISQLLYESKIFVKM